MSNAHHKPLGKLKKYILETLTSRFNLLTENCRGQTYDSASNMAGSNKGVVATHIQQIYPHAFYVCTLLKTIDIIAAYEQVNVMTGSLRELCRNIESILKNGV